MSSNRVVTFPTGGMDAVARLNWLAVIAGTPGIAGGSMRVAAVLASRQNHKTGLLNPSIGTIARESTLTTRAAQKAIRQLSDCGFLDVRSSLGGKPTNTNAYRLIFPKPKPLNADSPVNCGSGVNADSPVNCGSQTPEQAFAQPLNGSSPKQGREQGTNQESKKRNRDSLFEQWYRDYPNKTDRQKAEKAFAKIKPDESLVEEMIAALANQKADRERKVARGEWVPEWKYPATWLNGRCWENAVDEQEAGHEMPDWMEGLV